MAGAASSRERHVRVKPVGRVGRAELVAFSGPIEGNADNR